MLATGIPRLVCQCCNLNVVSNDRHLTAAEPILYNSRYNTYYKYSCAGNESHLQDCHSEYHICPYVNGYYESASVMCHAGG